MKYPAGRPAANHPSDGTINSHHYHLSGLLGVLLLMFASPEGKSQLPQIHPAARRDYAVVLVWHDVLPRRQVWFDTPTDLFRSQLEAIRKHGCHVVPLDTLLRHLTQGAPLPVRPVVLTFDDNNEGLYRNAFPLLKRYGYPATLFVHTDYVGVTTSKAHCTWDELRAMQTSGLISIQSLTQSHPADIRKLTDAEIGVQLRDSRASIEKHLGRSVYAFVYPEDRYDARVARDVAANGYKIAFTEDWGNACASPNLMMVHRYSILKRFAQALDDLDRAYRRP